MLRELKTNHKIDRNQWELLVKKSSTASFFQTQECYDFYKSLSFLEPFLMGVSENDELKGVVCGYITSESGKIKQFFSRRAIVPGGALLASDISNEALKMLLEEVKNSLKQKAIYVEFRNYVDFSDYKSTFQKAGFDYKPHLNFHITTNNVEEALKNLNTTKRRDVKLSQKEGAEIIDTKEPDDIKSYYYLLKNLYRTKIKTPLFPYEFFEKIINTSNGKLFVIKFQGNVIGGSLCVSFSDQILYEWFVCGEDRKYKNIYPSTLATWAAIAYASENGIKYFDMMGAGKPEQDYGVREFKAKFGGKLVEHGRFLYLTRPFLYKIGKKAIEFIKKRA